MGPHLPFVVVVGILLHARFNHENRVVVPQNALMIALAAWAGLYVTEVLVSFLSFLSGTAASVLGVLLSTAAGLGLLVAIVMVVRSSVAAAQPGA